MRALFLFAVLVMLATVVLPACGLDEPTPDPGAAGRYARVRGVSPPLAPPSGKMGGPAAHPLLAAERSSPWESCAEGFDVQAGLTPDLMRLTLACGPIVGMRPLGTASEGYLSADGDPWAIPFDVTPGRCYRAFAVAGVEVDDLELEVLTPDGDGLLAAGTRRSWAVLPADGPLCPDRPGRHLLRVRSHAGSGEARAQIWTLPGRPR